MYTTINQLMRTKLRSTHSRPSTSVKSFYKSPWWHYFSTTTNHRYAFQLRNLITLKKSLLVALSLVWKPPTNIWIAPVGIAFSMVLFVIFQETKSMFPAFIYTVREGIIALLQDLYLLLWEVKGTLPQALVCSINKTGEFSFFPLVDDCVACFAWHSSSIHGAKHHELRNKLLKQVNAVVVFIFFRHDCSQNGG